MATAFQQLADENVGGAVVRGVCEARGVSEVYRETYPVLLRYCQVATVEEVAPYGLDSPMVPKQNNTQ